MYVLKGTQPWQSADDDEDGILAGDDDVLKGTRPWQSADDDEDGILAGDDDDGDDDDEEEEEEEEEGRGGGGGCRGMIKTSITITETAMKR